MAPVRSEAALERKVCADAKEKYGIHSIKLNGRGETGWPDRVFLLGRGRVAFIEFKAPGGKLSAKQRYWLRYLQNEGYEWLVVNDYHMAMGYLRWVQDDTRP